MRAVTGYDFRGVDLYGDSVKGKKMLYGAPVYAYLRTYRLQIAEKLLREGELSVGEIATKIGYTNPNKFTSAFRGAYGMIPTEYKKDV